MRKLFFLIAILNVSLIYSQAFTGAGDNKLQVGANLQNGASGINLSFDYGLGENISVGVYGAYALDAKKGPFTAEFGDRIDLKARFNAHLGSIIGIDDNFDVYPGLDLSLKNFGAHLGARYFFSEGFGVFVETLAPLAKYNANNLSFGENIHNQFMVNLGAVFSL